MAGKPGKSGPPGNANALKHGGRAADRHGLQVGSLPPRYRDIQRSLSGVRRRLEHAVATAKGNVSVADAHLIATFLRWAQVAAIVQRLLLKSPDDEKPAQQISYATQIAEASAKCDAVLSRLGLAGAGGKSGSSVWDSLDDDTDAYDIADTTDGAAPILAASPATEGTP